MPKYVNRKKRAEETRKQIAAATMELHATIGPLKTTISAIADRAGVERLTVYRHFPDERSLFQACVAHGLEVWPLPDPSSWREVKAPVDRLRRGLEEVFEYYGATETAWANIAPDLPRLPALIEANAPTFAAFAEMKQVLMKGWKVRGRMLNMLEALVGHCLEFSTWQSLVKTQGLAPSDAIELVARAAISLTVNPKPRRLQGRT